MMESGSSLGLESGIEQPRSRKLGHELPISTALGSALALVFAAAMLGASLSFAAGSKAKLATQVSSAFEEARYAVGAEESLERKYRLEPGAAIRARHHDAGVVLLAALSRASAMGADVALIAIIDDEHTRYLASIARMFSAIDAQDTGLANKIDADEVDPTFDEIEEQVLTAAAFHRNDAATQLGYLLKLQRIVLVGTPIVFLPALALAAFCWTLLRRYRRKAEDGEHRFKSLVQNSSDVVLICSAAGKITYRSPTVETVWGFRKDCPFGDGLFGLAHPDERPVLQDIWDRTKTAPGTTENTEIRLRDAAGTWRAVKLILTNLLEEPTVRGIVVTAQDISARKSFEQELSRHAFHDSLTGLPNRALLLDRLGQALARGDHRGGRAGLIFLDLDNFKLINDGFGHHVGDLLLAEVASRLTASTPGESTVARLGGDEFVILLDSVGDYSDSIQVAKAVLAAFNRPFRLESRDVVVTVSMGIALGIGEQDSAASILRDADAAMYLAKSRGKSQYVVFDDTMHIDTLFRIEMESDLRVAFERKELRVYYQPIVDLEGGEISGVEALVRWQHPKRGLIEPTAFIPIAEETGLIVTLGQWVLKEACLQMAAWHVQYPQRPPMSVSVNLSPRQFQEKHLVDQVRQALRTSNLPPECLKLEITEGVIMRNVEATITTLGELKALGIRIAVDDFGTGYSSLAYLKRLPIDVLKIDRSFVVGIGIDKEDTAIVLAIISMAKSLDLSITAEGVETAEQSAMLQDWACDSGQGYYYARPLTADGLTSLIRPSPSGPPSGSSQDPTRFVIDRLHVGLEVSAGSS